VGRVGYGEKKNQNSTNEELFNDVKRVEYLKSYLQALAETMRYAFTHIMHNKLQHIAFAKVIQTWLRLIEFLKIWTELKEQM
jgi:hypothetical protein